MKVLNKIIKGVILAGIHLLTLFQCFLIAFSCAGMLLTVFLFGFDVVAGYMPFFAVKFYWQTCLIISLPFTVLFFVIVETDLVKKFFPENKTEPSVKAEEKEEPSAEKADDSSSASEKDNKQ